MVDTAWIVDLLRAKSSASAAAAERDPVVFLLCEVIRSLTENDVSFGMLSGTLSDTRIGWLWRGGAFDGMSSRARRVLGRMSEMWISEINHASIKQFVKEYNEDATPNDKVLCGEKTITEILDRINRLRHGVRLTTEEREEEGERLLRVLRCFEKQSER